MNYIIIIQNKKKIPFFLYNETLYNNNNIKNCLNKYQPHLGLHAGEYYFLKQLRHHQWRVHDGSKAILFIVPIMPTYQMRCGNIMETLNQMKKNLLKSPYFHKHKGKDHLIVGTHWKFNQHHIFKNVKNIVKNMIWSHYEIKPNVPWRCTVIAPYTSIWNFFYNQYYLHILSEIENYEITKWNKRKITFFFAGQADHRKAYKDRQLLLDQMEKYFPTTKDFFVITSSKDKKYSNCTFAKKRNGCHKILNIHQFIKILRDSKYNIMFHGDSPTSARFYDAISASSINIIASDGFYEIGAPFKTIIDWKKIALYVNMKEYKKNPVKTLKKIIHKINSTEILINMKNHYDDLIWNSPTSRVAENILMDAYHNCL